MEPSTPDTASATAPASSAVLSSSPIDITFAKVLFILVVLAMAWGTAYVLTFVLDRLAQRLPSHRLLFKRLVPILRLLIYAATIYLVITIVSPEETSLYAILGSMALALGLAAKDLLNDIIGGIVVLFDRSFQVGDRIGVGGQYGEVVSIGLRSTKIVTPDDSLVTVPNSTVLSSIVSNTNAGALDCQVVVDLYLPASLDLEQVESIAREAVLTSKMAYLNKPVVVNVKDEFKETYLTHLIVKAYVFDTRSENAFAADLTRRIKKELIRRGIVLEDVRFAGPDGAVRSVAGGNPR
jgi:small-conductance mechanosensitive channel